MEKTLVNEILKGANALENLRQGTDNIEYYPVDFCLEDLEEDNYIYQLIVEDKILLNEWDRSFTTAYLKFIGKTFEDIQEILNAFYRYDNMDLDYLYFGDYMSFLVSLDYAQKWLKESSDYKIKKEVCSVISKIFRRQIDLTGYVQNRDIRFGEVKDQLDFEEDAFKEDSKRMSEYTTKDGYEISENYICHYGKSITLSRKFLKLMSIDKNTGFTLTVTKGKDMQIFDRFILNLCKMHKAMYIPEIVQFARALDKICVNDEHLTVSDIENFNSLLNKMIGYVEDPETYAMLNLDKLHDTTEFGVSLSKECYLKLARILDTDAILEMLKYNANEDDLELIEEIKYELNIDEVTYYDDNLDYQGDDFDDAEFMDNLVMNE